jgi:hypothetical protein
MEVSNKELLEDIFNTEKEVEAYRMISDGLLILSSLPENALEKKYKYENLLYSGFEENCRKFLNKLYEIKSERNLE